MEYRRLGSSGLQLSALSFGAWVTFGRQVDKRAARAMLAYAYEQGVNYFDNAETYGAGVAETIMGEVLADLDFPRDSYCVSSKVYFGAAKDPKPTQRGLSRKHVFDACNQALKRLQVDYLDLYFCHRPDEDTPVAETVWAMDNLIRAGKALYWGTSEWSAARIREAHEVAEKHNLIAPTMEQPQYNLLHRKRFESEYAPLYSEYGMGTTIWSPLASGLLTGKYNEGVPKGSRLDQKGYEWLKNDLLGDDADKILKQIGSLAPIARELDCNQAQLALAWCLKKPHVSTVMLGASRLEQLEENMAALAVAERMDDATVKRIEAAVGG